MSRRTPGRVERKGTLSLGWGSKETVRISLEDETSHVLFAEVTISVLEFARALSSRSNRPCTYEAGGFEYLGKQLETKSEVIDVPTAKDGPDVAKRKKILRTYEVDGWMVSNGYDYDATNYHRHVPGGAKINFHRYVEEKK